MKKIVKYLSIILGMFLLTGCFPSYLKSIDYSTFKEKIDNKDSFILEVVQTGCSACKKFTPRFRKIVNKYEIEVYQLNYSDLNDEDKKEFDSNFTINSTPTVLFIKEGEEPSVMNRIVGAEDDDVVIERLKSLDYIKEEEE